jgi:hypothetical protein
MESVLTEGEDKNCTEEEIARYSDTLLPIYQTTRLHALEDNLSCHLCGILYPSK